MRKGGLRRPSFYPLFLFYQVGSVHYAKLEQLSGQWNEGVAKYFRLGLLTGFGVLILTVCGLLVSGYDGKEGQNMATATLDWSQCPAVESIPGKRSGAWVFKGTRTPVSTVFENLQDMSVDELVEEFGVTREQVQAVLQFAAHSAEARPPRP